MRSHDALFGRVTYAAGPSPTRYGSYPGTALEPQQINNLQIMRNNGYPQLWVELCEQILERDGHLGGIYDTRRQAVADKPFRLHPSRRGDALAESVAKLQERMLDKIDLFDQAIEDLLSATAYGYALSEIVWAWANLTIPLPDGTTRVLRLRVPQRIEWVHWKHLRFDRNTDEPYLWMDRGEDTLAPNKFIFHAAAGTGFVERRGFMGACTWLSSAKRWSERDWLVYAKLFAIPNILGKFPDGDEHYEAHRAEYVQWLKNWGEGIPALLPDSLKTEISREPAGRSNDVCGAIIGWANAEMSKRVLGSTLTVEIGGQGAYAAADTHRDAPYVRSRTDARKLCATLRQQLLRPFLVVNQVELAAAYGVSAEDLIDANGQCSFRIEREMAPKERHDIFAGAVNDLGLEVDEDQYRNEFGIDSPRTGTKRMPGKPQPVTKGGELVGSVEASRDGATAPDDAAAPGALAAEASSASDGEAAETPK